MSGYLYIDNSVNTHILCTQNLILDAINPGELFDSTNFISFERGQIHQIFIFSSVFIDLMWLSAKANLMRGFCLFFIFYFSTCFHSLCVCTSLLLSLVLNGTPGVLKLVVVTHRVILFSLPFSSAYFSDRRGRRSPSTIDDLLFCSCTLAPLH